MARGFMRRGDAFVALLTPSERVVIAQLAGDVIELLAGEDDEQQAPNGDLEDAPEESLAAILQAISAPAQRPADPALLLLLPDAARDDDLAEEFRRLTEDGLRHHKVSRLLALARRMLAVEEAEGDTLQELVVSPQDAEEVAGAMTDLRLVLATRLGIQDDDDAERLWDDLTETAGDASQGTMVLDRGAMTGVAKAPRTETRPPEAGTDPHRGSPPSGTVRWFMGSAFMLLGGLQESLIDGMLGSLPDGPCGTEAENG